MTGTVYCVGVGPGDPELLTLKAVRLIREADLIAVPSEKGTASVAYRIAEKAVPEIGSKDLLPLAAPMVKDRAIMDAAHKENAALVKKHLEQGKNVVFLTLGDPTVYCTFTYMQQYLEADGCRVEFVSGVTSFCAAAARLCMPLAEWDEPLHIVPAVHRTENLFGEDGNYILMKSASHMAEVKEQIRQTGRKAVAVENCGMENERIYPDLDAIPDDAGYFSLLIVKK